MVRGVLGDPHESHEDCDLRSVLSHWDILASLWITCSEEVSALGLHDRRSCTDIAQEGGLCFWYEQGKPIAAVGRFRTQMQMM